MIDVCILTKNRVNELCLLLQSLRTQTFKKFDVIILDDGSEIPIVNNYNFNVLMMRMRNEGNKVMVLRNNQSRGIATCRQFIDDYAIKNSKNELICRLDDDCIVENDYLEKLLMVINEGFDLASGVTPPMAGNLLERDTRFVMPVINRVFIDKDGFIVNSDDCGFKYAEDKIIITDHFRSCALYKKSVCEKVRYEDNLANSGFREEEFFSFRMILEGFKLGVHTGAIAWHLQAQSGGDRKPDYTNHALINQKLLNRFVIKQFEKNGNFIEKYHERLGLEMPKLNSVKNTNLIFSKEV